MNYEVHPLADAFPIMDGEPFRQLVDSIRKHGLLEPIVVKDGTTIIDGRNRFRACSVANVSPNFEEYRLDMPIHEYIWIKNVERRHMTEDQRAAVILRWEKYEADQSKVRMLSGKVDPEVDLPQGRGPQTRDLLAARADVTVNKVRQAQAVKKHDAEHGTDLLSAVKKGDMDLRVAAKRTGFTKEKKKGSALRRAVNPWKFDQQLKQVETFIKSKLAAAPKSHRGRLEIQILRIVRVLCKEANGETQSS